MLQMCDYSDIEFTVYHTILREDKDLFKFYEECYGSFGVKKTYILLPDGPLDMWEPIEVVGVDYTEPCTWVRCYDNPKPLLDLGHRVMTVLCIKENEEKNIWKRWFFVSTHRQGQREVGWQYLD